MEDQWLLIEHNLAWRAILWMNIVNRGMNAVRIQGSLTLKQVQLKIGILRCFKVAKRAATPLKKPYGEKKLTIGLARANNS